ncbi:MAG TPA: hypothetical protein VG318_09935 [Actinomycetota bacterium]|nr:hypothetical protein [Actinomycetota bacterium]
MRRLPSLYVNDVQVFADRDVGRVVATMRRAVDAFVASAQRPTYMLTACEIGGRVGLYGTDFFNRSSYRRKLQRLGMRFSDTAFVTFCDDGRFEADGFGRFDATFLTLGTPPEDGPPIQRVTGALLLYQLVFYRIADIADEELARLAAVAGRLDALSAARPEDLVTELTT